MNRRFFLKLGAIASAILAVPKASALDAVKSLLPAPRYIHTTGTYYAFGNGLEFVHVGRRSTPTLMRAFAFQVYDLEKGEWIKDRMNDSPKRVRFDDLAQMTNNDLVDLGLLFHSSYEEEPHARMSMYLPRQNTMLSPIAPTSKLWPHVNHELRKYNEQVRLWTAECS